MINVMLRTELWKSFFSELEWTTGLLEWNIGVFKLTTGMEHITRLATVVLECITNHSLLFSSVLTSPIMVLMKVPTQQNSTAKLSY